ncbi:hypothetical protein [Aquimarina algiphila]|uniref:hypothetical protein n=1 Tax=Aquimarina algiphila TaxID=2047982 RepID=UPI0024930672|nr:hypothetical protein [Aquimarina algiphila]
MPIVERSQLRGYFGVGDRPTSGQFRDLIDSMFNLAEDEFPSIQTQGWTTNIILDEDFDIDVDRGVIDALDVILIPAGSNQLNTIRTVFEVSSGRTGDAIVTFFMMYISDNLNEDYEAFPLYGETLFNHMVLSEETITIPNSSETTIVDEYIRVDLPLEYENMRVAAFGVQMENVNTDFLSTIFVGYEYS